jgi:DNA topoisomerase-2
MSGIAVGFSCNILPRKIDDIIDNCINHLKGIKANRMIPYIDVFNGLFENDVENHKRWIITGLYERTNKSTIKIKELPPSFTYEKYEELLDKLVDDKTIVSYEDNCKDNIDYIIKIKQNSDFNIKKVLKLEDYSTEIFATLDENGKLKIFETDIDIVEYFVDFRLIFYSKRKEKITKKIQSELILLTNKSMFIKAILNKKIVIANRKKDDIFEQIKILKIDEVDGSYDYLLKMPIYSLTKEIYDKLLNDIQIKQKELEIIKKMDAREMYIADLEELKKEIKKI